MAESEFDGGGGAPGKPDSASGAAPASIPDGRCGHVATLEGIDGIGAVCCWRETWDDSERCRWHADGDVPRTAYADGEADPGERLDGAILRNAALTGADVLAGRSLVGADFTGAVLDHADLSGADLRRATFRDVDAHGATFAGATLHDSVFTFVDLRGADFEGAKLYRAGLTDVRVDLETEFGGAVYENEFEGREASESVARYADSATWVYRELQRLYDENALPDQANDYYLREMELRRRGAWHLRNWRRALTLEGSRLVTRYGTSPWRVIATSAALILVCAALYPLTGGIQEVGADSAITYRIEDPTDAPPWLLLETYFKGLYFSVTTFATLGYGDMQPVGSLARIIAGVETLLGSLLMAVLVFVLTRSIR
ncbi:pentapeptide repeat-containing protein [Natrialbaceae archaeon GCM10025810]|uniref:pentapeptide repeat-containing protein n=1 Tax=Halovalidus salilacus TaxID=3075124 RepID=UPI0036174A62